jgi:hypothetical protein
MIVLGIPLPSIVSAPVDVADVLSPPYARTSVTPETLVHAAFTPATLSVTETFDVPLLYEMTILFPTLLSPNTVRTWFGASKLQIVSSRLTSILSITAPTADSNTKLLRPRRAKDLSQLNMLASLHFPLPGNGSLAAHEDVPQAAIVLALNLKELRPKADTGLSGFSHRFSSIGVSTFAQKEQHRLPMTPNHW